MTKPVTNIAKMKVSVNIRYLSFLFEYMHCFMYDIYHSYLSHPPPSQTKIVIVIQTSFTDVTLTITVIFITTTHVFLNTYIPILLLQKFFTDFL